MYIYIYIYIYIYNSKLSKVGEIMLYEPSRYVVVLTNMSFSQNTTIYSIM